MSDKKTNLTAITGRIFTNHSKLIESSSLEINSERTKNKSRRMQDLDMSDKLQEAFSQYLTQDQLDQINSKKQGFRDSESRDGMLSELKPEDSDDVQSEQSFHKLENLNKFFQQVPPEFIRDELTKKFDALKNSNLSSPKTDKEQVYNKLKTKKVICEKKEIKINDKKNHNLVIIPTQFDYHSFRLGCRIKRVCSIRNDGSSLLKGFIMRPESSEWYLSTIGEFTLSPGLTLNLNVIFEPADENEKKSHFYVAVVEKSTSDITKYKVDLIARAGKPALEGFQTSTDEQETRTYIDIGKYYVGQKSSNDFKLINKGNPASFVILNKSDEVSSFKKIQAPDDNTCICCPFTIRPSQFSLNKNKKVTLAVEFDPKDRGTAVAKMMIITDKDDVIYFDIIGEAYTFQTSQILFNDITKDYPVDTEDDIRAKYYIDLGQSFATGKLEKTFTVTNKGALQIKYHWELRAADVNDECRDLEPNQLKIVPLQGTMESDSEIEFHVCYTFSNRVPSKYKTVLRFIADDLQRECLDSDDKDCVIQTSTNNQNQEIVSVICGEIELWAEIILPGVIVSPSVLYLTSVNYRPLTLTINIKNLINKHIGIDLTSPSPTTQSYSLHTKNFPHRIILEGLESQDVTFHMKFFKELCEPQIFYTITFSINDGEVTIDVPVNVSVTEKATQRNENKDININDVVDTSHGDLISLHPLNKESLVKVFKTMLIKMDKMKKTFKETSTAKNLIRDVLELNFNDGLVSGVTVWRGEDHVGWFLGDMRSCHVCAKPSQVTLSCYLENHEVISITLVNESLVPTNYRWGDAFGDDKDMLKTWVTKRSGTIYPDQKIQVEVYIYPTSPGFLVEYKIPCFLSYTDEPLLLNLNGEVKSLKVLLEWPTEEGIYETILEYTLDGRLSSIGKIKSSFNQEPLSGILTALGAISIQNIMSGLRGGALSSSLYPDIKYMCKYDTCELRDSNITVINDSDLVEESNLLESEFREAMGCQICDMLTTFISGKAIRFNLLAGQSETRKLRIKNVTPIKTSYSINAEIFYADKIAPEFPHDLFTMESSCTTYSREFLETVERNKKIKVGLYFEIDKQTEELRPYQEVVVHVTAKPDIWGEYVDVLVVNITGLPSYSVPVTVSCHGPPISFTFDPREDPHFRFGTLTPGEQVSYDVTLKNNTFVPLKIAWVTYCKHLKIKHRSKKDKDLPLSVAIDIHNPMNGNFCRLDVTEYYGLQVYNPFTVTPNLCVLNSFGEIKLNFSVKIPEQSIEGYLEGSCVGIIYQDDSQWSSWRSLCYRPTGFKTELYKVTLSANIQIPYLEITPVDSSTCFMVVAKELQSKQHITEDKIFLLKNKSQADTKFCITLDSDLFRVIKLLSFDDKLIKYNGEKDEELTLHPGKIVKVVVRLYITSQILSEDGSIYYSDVINDILCPTRKYQLVIHQRITNITQSIELKCQILYPYFKLSTERMVFGPVFIKENKLKILRITSVTDDEKFNIELSSAYETGKSPFSFSPKSGFIKRGEYIEIQVTFSPRESEGYLDKLFIKTSVNDFQFVVTLEGVGTWNYKFHQLVQ